MGTGGSRILWNGRDLESLIRISSLIWQRILVLGLWPQNGIREVPKMKLIVVAFILLPVLMISAYGQQTNGSVTKSANFTVANGTDPTARYALVNQLTLGVVRLNEGKYNESLDAYNKFIESIDDKILQPNNWELAAAWDGKGNAFYALGKYDEAIKAFDKAREIDPEDAYPWIGKGRVLDAHGEYNESIKCYTTAIELDPQNVDAWDAKGWALYFQERYDEAAKAFGKIVEKSSR